MENIKDALKKAKVSENEISSIVRNLEEINKMRLSENDKNKIVQNLTDKKKFRKSFIKDYVKALKNVGINPVPSP